MGIKKPCSKKLYRELLSHAHAEQETVYAKAEERIDRSKLTQAHEEHADIEQRLNTLRTVDPSSPERESQLQDLEDHVTHHVEEEEETLFKEMQNTFSEEEAEGMGKAFHEVKERKMKELEEKMPR